MCGIAGLIHRGKSSNVGGEMTSMLQALKHRGPDSTGYAVYGKPTEGDYIMRFKAAEAGINEPWSRIHQVSKVGLPKLKRNPERSKAPRLNQKKA